MINIEDYMKLSKEKRQKHLKLTDPCIERGTTSTHCRGILAHYLDTNLNSMSVKVDCCHACNNPACSNPNHLYWGTRSENVDDLLTLNPNARKNCGQKGEKNPNFKINPWNNAAMKNNIAMFETWKNCIYLYDNYYLNNWEFDKYGKGETYFYNKYNFSRATINYMWKKFRENWNPYNDNEYIEWYGRVMEW